MPITVKVKLKPRYSVRCVPDEAFETVELYDRKLHSRRILRLHQQAYTVLDWLHTCAYFNERDAGYPVPESLTALRSQHDEDRRRSGGDFPPPAKTRRLRLSYVGRRTVVAGEPIKRRKGRAARK